MITDRICAVVVSTMKVEELAEKGCGFGEHASAGEDVEEDGVREGMRTVMGVFGCIFGGVSHFLKVCFAGLSKLKNKTCIWVRNNNNTKQCKWKDKKS